MPYTMHAIETIDGIGKARGQALREQGISTTEDLVNMDEVALRLKVARIPRFPEDSLPDFMAMATFLQLPGVDDEIAEALVEAGYNSLDDLVMPHAGTILSRLEEIAAAGILREAVTLAQVGNWQKEAVRLTLTGVLAGRVLGNGEVESDPQPLANVEVLTTDRSAVTNAEGRFWLPGVPIGDRTMHLRREGYQTLRLPVAVDWGRPPRMELRLVPGVDNEVVVEESSGGWIREFGVEDEIVFVDMDAGQLVDGEPLTLRYRYRDGKVRLQTVNRTRRNHQLLVGRLQFPAGSIPDRAPIEEVFLWRDGRLEDTGMKLTDYVIHQFQSDGPLSKVEGEFVRAERVA
jgi:hypothetical protein